MLKCNFGEINRKPYQFFLPIHSLPFKVALDTKSREFQYKILNRYLVTNTFLQSIYVTRDRVILKFEASVQIYVAVLNFGCEIQNLGGNVVSISKINSCELSF